MRAKVTVIGAGNVGATVAQEVARGDYADVVLVDIVQGLPQGKALDMNEAGPVLGYEARIAGTNSYDDTADSDIVVVTSGRPRAPGMSRDDLVTTNQTIVASVTQQAVDRSPRCDRRRRDEPARRHVPRGEDGLGPPQGARLRDGRHPGHGPLPDLHRLGDGLVGPGRAGDGARRARRPDGPRWSPRRASAAFP